MKKYENKTILTLLKLASKSLLTELNLLAIKFLLEYLLDLCMSNIVDKFVWGKFFDNILRFSHIDSFNSVSISFSVLMSLSFSRTFTFLILNDKYFIHNSLAIFYFNSLTPRLSQKNMFIWSINFFSDLTFPLTFSTSVLGKHIK